MGWKRYFKAVGTNNNPNGMALPASPDRAGTGTSAKFSSYLPEVYAGHPNRIQRYYQYDDMDRDSDINAALDTISDFSTQSEEQSDEPFEIKYNNTPTETQVSLIKTSLVRWIKLNSFRSRLYHMFRSTIKNGDAFFLRDPETGEWLWIDTFMVELVKVDDTAGKEPAEYVIRGLDLNKQAKFATVAADPSQYRAPFGSNPGGGARPNIPQSSAGAFSLAGADANIHQRNLLAGAQNQLVVVDAENVVHLSLSVGMDVNWPFGASILEPVFKTYKQKELLEDSIIIYRVQRAPERRIFYIDTGAMPPDRAKAHIERVKNEIHQRRIPNRGGGGGSIVDSSYNPLCVAMDTKIPLLDGRTLTIEQLGEEYRNGKENWTYSCDPETGEILPGNITWAGKTRQLAKVIKLTFDNGESLVCTPDHKIPVLGKGYVEAQNLTPNDSLIAFNTQLKNLASNNKNDRTYTQVFDHKKKEWVYSHRMVGEFFRNKNEHEEMVYLAKYQNAVKQTIHHKNYDRYNNSPNNLAYMAKDDHIWFHVHEKAKYWNEMPEEESLRIKTQISQGLKDYYSARTNEQKSVDSEKASIRSRKVIAKMRSDNPEGYRRLKQKQGKALSNMFVAGTEAAKNRSKHMKNRVTSNQILRTSTKLISMIVDLVKSEKPKRIEAAKILSSDQCFLDEFARVNPPQEGYINKLQYNVVSPMTLDRIIERSGYKGWRDLTKKVALYNHRVVSIEVVEQTMDVGTLTIDGNEQHHGHHNFAISAGIFIKNSMLDDYYFAVGSEGRGSRVETLPGGEMAGEIGDLLFFSKKLARGLRIPTSYLALGGDQDENGGSYNDGKLGAAMIQEFRFNKFCMRIQALLAPKFDKEFKWYLRKTGIEIEDDLFELRFRPPQNFTKYRQVEMDTAQMSVYTQIQENKYLSQRFKLKRFLNLTDEELIENEKLWSEENAERLKKKTGAAPSDTSSQDLSSVGITGGDMGDMGDLGGEEPPEGEEPPPPDAGGGAPTGGAGGAAPPTGAAPAGGAPPT